MTGLTVFGWYVILGVGCLLVAGVAWLVAHVGRESNERPGYIEFRKTGTADGRKDTYEFGSWKQVGRVSAVSGDRVAAKKTARPFDHKGNV